MENYDRFAFLLENLSKPLVLEARLAPLWRSGLPRPRFHCILHTNDNVGMQRRFFGEAKIRFWSPGQTLNDLQSSVLLSAIATSDI